MVGARRQAGAGSGRQRLAFVVRDGLARISSCIIQEVDVDKGGAVSMAAPATATHPSLR